MSKTYYTRHTVQHSKPVIEYKQTVKDDWTGKEIKAGSIKKYDCTNTTNGDNCDVDYLSRINSRHPNKKRHRRLIKEFRETGTDYLGPTIYRFDHRTGDITQRRQRKILQEMGRTKRRFQLKLQAKKIIDEGIDEYNKNNW